MHQYYRYIALLFLLPFFMVSKATAELRIEITESAGVQNKVPIAIVPFAVESATLSDV